jgi:transcriptional regulator of acetoin/glycerol metabolism
MSPHQTLIGLCKTKLTKLYLDGRRATGDMIEEALRETRGNKQQAAQILGLSRQGLIKMLKRLRIG